MREFSLIERTLFSVWISLTAMSTAYAHDPDIRHRRDYDKTLHFTLGALGTASSIKGLQAIHPQHDITNFNRITSTILVLTVAYFKEVHDARVTGKSFDTGDMEATAYGVVMGHLLQWEF